MDNIHTRNRIRLEFSKQSFIYNNKTPNNQTYKITNYIHKLNKPRNPQNQLQGNNS